MKVRQSLSCKVLDDLVLSIAYNLKINSIITAEDLEKHLERKKCMIQKGRWGAWVCVRVCVCLDRVNG